MKTEEIKQLFKEFESAAFEIEGVECWSAREMQTLLGYSKWENFQKIKNQRKHWVYYFLFFLTLFPSLFLMILKGIVP